MRDSEAPERPAAKASFGDVPLRDQLLFIHSVMKRGVEIRMDISGRIRATIDGYEPHCRPEGTGAGTSDDRAVGIHEALTRALEGWHERWLRERPPAISVAAATISMPGPEKVKWLEKHGMWPLCPAEVVLTSSCRQFSAVYRDGRRPSAMESPGADSLPRDKDPSVIRLQLRPGVAHFPKFLADMRPEHFV